MFVEPTLYAEAHSTHFLQTHAHTRTHAQKHIGTYDAQICDHGKCCKMFTVIVKKTICLKYLQI